ncbi:WGR domain-containing protein [Rhizobium sp. TRM95796]|uniref:WGR domain-containing protein n=1 Tax=Rhizobium sp. TRM95796 TaxID=2979862 RepID=UPI0021E76906|nr:WGR domain-containing protein [Rhizobium sp. TRM95796]MCV3768737.1 WGR domain-containing protein [Rhizobium sp. TRM95796]
MENAIELERKCEKKNMARFYRLEIERDLFGIVIARRTWGRIGSVGRTIAAPCLSLEDAERELRLWETRKRRRGYHDRAPA